MENKSMLQNQSGISTYTYAEFLRRTVAFLVDALIIWMIMIIPRFFLFQIATISSFEPISSNSVFTFTDIFTSLFRYHNFSVILSNNMTSRLIDSVILFAISVFYHSICEASTLQGSLGKNILHMIVTDESGNRISFERALIRNISKILSQSTYYIGYLFAAFTEKKQTLHDMIAHTLVLKKIN